LHYKFGIAAKKFGAYKYGILILILGSKGRSIKLNLSKAVHMLTYIEGK